MSSWLIPDVSFEPPDFTVHVSQVRSGDIETEKRLRKDLKRTKALLADAQIMLDHIKNNAPSKREIAQLKNQVGYCDENTTICTLTAPATEIWYNLRFDFCAHPANERNRIQLVVLKTSETLYLKPSAVACCSRNRVPVTLYSPQT